MGTLTIIWSFCGRRLLGYSSNRCHAGQENCRYMSWCVIIWCRELIFVTKHAAHYHVTAGGYPCRNIGLFLKASTGILVNLLLCRSTSLQIQVMRCLIYLQQHVPTPRLGNKERCYCQHHTKYYTPRSTITFALQGTGFWIILPQHRHNNHNLKYSSNRCYSGQDACTNVITTSQSVWS